MYSSNDGQNNNLNNSYPNNVNSNINTNQNFNYMNNNTSSDASSKRGRKSISKSSKLAIILLLLAAVLIVSSILIFGANKSSSRTIMIYVSGSNLESDSGLATADLESIDYNKLASSNTKVVVIAGGATRWMNNYINPNETSIFELTEDGFKTVKKQSKLNMGDPNTLSSFLNYVRENYKTDKYDLIFWNHGGAIQGSEYDDNFENDNLSLTEIKKALSKTSFNNNNKIELVIFRTCLNGTLEVASTLDDYAQYMVASEEATLGSSNTSVLNFINNIDSKDSAIDVGKKYIESYKKQIDSIKKYNSYFGSGSSIYSTYSVVDLSKIDNLENSVNEFFGSIDVKSNYAKIAKLRSSLYQYPSTTADYDMIDLLNLVDGLKDLSSDNASKVQKAFDDVIVYNWATNSNSRGMSIYFPYRSSKEFQLFFLNTYKEFENLKPYAKFISDFYNIQNTSTKSYSFENNKINIKSNDSGTSDFTLQLTDEQLEGYAKASYIVFEERENGYYGLVYSGKDVKLEGNTLKANVKGRHLQLYSKSDNFRQIIPLFESDYSDDYITYSTAVILQDTSSDNISDWKIDSALLELYYDKTKNKIGISNLVLNSKDLPGVIALSLKDYTSITFGSMGYKILDENGNYTENWENNGIYEGAEFTTDDLNFELADFSKNTNYYCVFKIYDINNNYYYSKMIKMN